MFAKKGEHFFAEYDRDLVQPDNRGGVV